VSPFNNILNIDVNMEPLKDHAKETLELLLGIVAAYEADPTPEDLIKFSTYHHAKRMLAKIAQEDAPKN